MFFYIFGNLSFLRLYFNYMRSSCLMLILLFFPIVVVSQNTTDKEKLVEEFYFKGLEFSNTQKDSSYFYYRRALNYAQELQHYSDAIEVLYGLILTGRKHGDIDNHRLFLRHIDSILTDSDIQSKIDDYQYYENRFNYEKATYFYNLRDYDQAKQYFQKLSTLLSKKELAKLDEFEFNLLIHTTNYLALIYSHNSKYDLAETYFNRSLNFIERKPVDESEIYRLATLQLLAQLHRFTQKHSISNSILNEVLSAYKVRYANDEGYKNNVNAAYSKLAENAIDQQKLKEALSYLEEGQQYLLDEDPFYKSYLILYGDIYTGLNDGQSALEIYEKALRLFKEYRQNKAHQDIAKVHGRIAKFYLKQNEYQEGLETIQKAFNVAGDNIQIIDFKQNPDPREVFSKTQLLNLLDIKLQLLQGSYEETTDAAYQDAIQQTSHYILKTFDLLKSEFDSKIDKQFLAEKAYPIFHRLLETTYKAYEKNPSAETLELALNIVEKNKDFVLLEALRSAQATQYGDVPKNVLEKEAQLRAEITNLEKQLFDATETENGFSDALFKRKQEYFIFLDTIKNNYPKYHELKYQNRALDLTTVRNKVLDDNGTLISYTMAGDYLYAIVVNGSKEDFLKLPFDETDRKVISKFYRLLSSPSINRTEKEISEIAHLLFEKILKKPLADFDSENLTIIPDGELHYLPFDLLQENGSYLLETKSIGFGNSVTSLIELREKKHAETNKMLALAPSFTGVAIASTDRQFGKLLYNDDEVQKIGAFYDTEKFLEKEATLANFMSEASQFNIFHLATHASANDEYPDYSYLAFTETNDSTESNILYIKDLYNTTLNADMVTLSACQTGIGQLQKGQGMLSLSKGFYYAGAKSLVNTLWKINDKSTVKLMEYFYEGLSKGYSKSEALRKAKLKYLETTDDALLKHPYYWAAFVVSGDVSPISNNNTLWWIIGFGVFTLLLGGFFLKKQKRLKKIRP